MKKPLNIRAYNGVNLTDEYIKENLTKRESFARLYAGISATDFIKCSRVFTFSRVREYHRKKYPFSKNDVLEPLLSRCFYHVMNKCLYERKEFVFSRGKVGFYYFPNYYETVCRNGQLEPYLDYTDSDLRLGGILLRPFFPRETIEKLKLFKNPIQIRGDSQFQKDVALVINSKGNLIPLSTFTVEDVAKDLYPMFSYLPFGLVMDSINEFFKTYLRLSIKGIPINLTYTHTKQRNEETGKSKFMFRIINYTNIEEAVIWYYRKGVERIFLEATKNKRFKKHKFKRMKYVLLMNEHRHMLRSFSDDELCDKRDQLHIKFKYDRLETETLLNLYECSKTSSYKRNSYREKNERIQIPSTSYIDNYSDYSFTDDYLLQSQLKYSTDLSSYIQHLK